jgi:hypothetical protein
MPQFIHIRRYIIQILSQNKPKKNEIWKTRDKHSKYLTFGINRLQDQEDNIKHQ